MKSNELRRILIVEDDSYVHELLNFMLTQRTNYVITAASDGQQALDVLEEEIPGLIFLDYMLPKIDGLEVCRRIKNSDKTKHIPVIMMSASPRLKEQTKLPLCADYYITKPFNMVEVMGIVDNIFKEGPK